MEQKIYRVARWDSEFDKDGNFIRAWSHTISYVRAYHENAVANIVHIMNDEVKSDPKTQYSYEKVEIEDLYEALDGSLVSQFDYGICYLILDQVDKDKRDEVELIEGAEKEKKTQTLHYNGGK